MSRYNTKCYMVELETGVWLAPWTGDPGRTLVRHCAREYKSLHGAKTALGQARKYRQFVDAQILPYRI